MKLRLPLFFLGMVALVLFAGSVRAAGTAAYFRYPDIHGDQVVFSAEADLWIVSDQGGVARRLTTHPGNEYFANFSPDGKWIAFTGQYDGNNDVYVISAEGGEPRRLTWHPSSDEVVGWTPDGKNVLFHSARTAATRSTELFQVPVSGGDPERLPLGWANRIDIDPQSGMWAFNRKSWENLDLEALSGRHGPRHLGGRPEEGRLQADHHLRG